jgi:hypothetical protein
MLLLVVNGEAVFEYRTRSRLPGHVRDLLAHMDADMDDGFTLAGRVVEQPDNMQRAYFVALQLFRSFTREDERLRIASSAWLCRHMPGLREVKVEESEEEFSLELIMDNQ